MHTAHIPVVKILRLFVCFWYLQGLSKAELTHIVACVKQHNQQDHTLLIRGQLKLEEVDSYCKMLQEACRGVAAPFVISTTQNEWKEGISKCILHSMWNKCIIVIYSIRCFGWPSSCWICSHGILYADTTSGTHYDQCKCCLLHTTRGGDTVQLRASDVAGGHAVQAKAAFVLCPGNIQWLWWVQAQINNIIAHCK